MKKDDYNDDEFNDLEENYLEKQDEFSEGNIESKDIIDVDEIYEYDDYVKKDKKKGKKFFKTKFTIIIVLITALLSIFSPIIQEVIFRSEDSKIFVPQGGIFGTRIGTVIIVLGIYLIVYSVKYLFKKDSKFNTKQKWAIIVIGVLISTVGISTFFRYIEYKENTIVQNSIFQQNSYTYLDITEVNVSTRNLNGDNSTLKYEYKLKNGKYFTIKVTESNYKEVRNIDNKIKSTARRSIDNFSIQEMERLGMYSRDEALKLFIIE